MYVIINTNKRGIIMGEINGIYVKPFLKAKREYYLSEKYLKRISEHLKTYIDNLYQEINYSQMIRTNCTLLELSDDGLLNIIRSFFYSLNDKDIKNAIDYIIDNKLYRFIPYDINNPECHVYEGYTNHIKVDENDEMFTTLYRNYTVKDLQIGVHEFAHAITKIIFNNKVSPIFFHFLSENEAYFFELLFLKNYLNKVLGGNAEIPFILEQNRLVYICENIWNIKVMEAAFKGFTLSFNPTIINKRLSNIPNSSMITESDKNEIQNTSLMASHRIIHSYMLALIQVEWALKDLEKGLYNFKSMQTEPVSEIDSIEKLYEKYDTDYTSNNPLFKRELMNHQTLKKIISEENK